MASFKNFSKRKQAEREGSFYDFDNPYSHDPIREESIEYEEWSKFLSYYRYYVDKFATDILGLNLYPFQKLILRAMARYPNAMLICCRGIGKSYLCAIFMVCMAILYPGLKIGICSGKGQQARNVIIQKIQGELIKNQNIAREISGRIKTSADDCSVMFKNGSEIRAITLGFGQSGDNARSWRFGLILVDEARLVMDKTVEEVLVPMTKTKRQNVIDAQFKNPDLDIKESGRMLFISSAYLKTCDLYKRFLHHYNQMINGSDKYFVVSLDYRVGVDAGIFELDDIMDEKNKPTMTLDAFIYEYEGVFVGSSKESYYPYELTSKCRILDHAELKEPKKNNYPYIITHDVAVSNKNNSDNACTHVIKLIPRANGTFYKEVVFTKTMNGVSLRDQCDFLRELIHIKFPSTMKLVIDAQSAGEGLLSLLEEPWKTRDDKGNEIQFPQLICDDDDEARMLLPDALDKIRAIKATSEFNTSFYPYMKTCCEDKSLRLLSDSHEVDEAYKDGEISPEEFYVHVEHDNLIEELSNIKQNISSQNKILYDRIIKRNKRDRATSLMYGLSVVYELEREGKADIYRSKVDDETYLMNYIY